MITRNIRLNNQTQEIRDAIRDAFNGMGRNDIAKKYGRPYSWSARRIETAKRFGTWESYISYAGPLPLDSIPERIAKAKAYAMQNETARDELAKQFVIALKDAGRIMREVREQKAIEAAADMTSECNRMANYLRDHPKANRSKVLQMFRVTENEYRRVRLAVTTERQKAAREIAEARPEPKPTIIGRTRTKLLCNNGGNWELPENVKKWSDNFSFSVEVV
jgi:hypothetical protein